jgi:hypothetical protein
MATSPVGFVSRVEEIQKTFGKRKFQLEMPHSDFPELIITVPDSWPYIDLTPWYDVHHGHRLHATKLFKKHVEKFLANPYALGWNGGDFIENSVEGSPGMFSQRTYPGEQFDEALDLLAPMQHKLAFAIPGNHEARTFRVAGIDIAKLLASDLKIPYFPDYCFATIRWRNMKFRICAHHGTGAAASPGGQRNAARKDMPWVGCDLYWTGHLHQPIADVVYRADFDQSSDRMVTRSSVVIISPSYLEYFRGYAAAKRYGPGQHGVTIARLESDGNIAVTVTAKGKRI